MSYSKEEIAVQDYVSELYEKNRYKKPYSFAYHKWWAEKMLSSVKLREPILDNGCGPGFMAQFLASYDVVGIDISPKMVKLAQKRYSKVIQGDSQHLPFKDDSFMTVINKGVLHHLEDPQKAVEEISRVLKPGGQAVFAESVSNILNSLPRKLMRGTRHFSSLHKNFREEELKRIIESSLKIEKVSYFGYLAYVLFVAPDVVDLYKFVPFKRFFTSFLIKFDEIMAKIPILKKHLCWCIMITAKKKS